MAEATVFVKANQLGYAITGKFAQMAGKNRQTALI
jgi:Polyphosphate kinase 2 (PPK2)